MIVGFAIVFTLAFFVIVLAILGALQRLASAIELQNHWYGVGDQPQDWTVTFSGGDKPE